MIGTVAYVEHLAKKFAGLDVSKRSSSSGWPLPWRARVISTLPVKHQKNENVRASKAGPEFRIEAYGETMKDAVENLMEAVQALVEK